MDNFLDHVEDSDFHRSVETFRWLGDKGRYVDTFTTVRLRHAYAFFGPDVVVTDGYFAWEITEDGTVYVIGHYGFDNGEDGYTPRPEDSYFDSLVTLLTYLEGKTITTKMDEPKEIGSVVLCWLDGYESRAVRADEGPEPWFVTTHKTPPQYRMRGWRTWDDIENPRPYEGD